MKQYSERCFCTNCIYKSPSVRSSGQKLIADGKRADKLHVSNLPLHKRKVSEKLIKSHTASEYIRNRLVSASRGSDQIKSEYTSKSKEHTAVLNMIHLHGSKQIRSSHLTKPCSCCNHCSHSSIIKRHPSVCQHCIRQLNVVKCKNSRRQRFGSKMCAAIKGIRSNPKNVCSAPCLSCLCKTFMINSSNALATSGLNKSYSGTKSRCNNKSYETDNVNGFVVSSANGCFNHSSRHQQIVKIYEIENRPKDKNGIPIFKKKVDYFSFQNQEQSNRGNKTQKKLAGLKPYVDKGNQHFFSFNDENSICTSRKRNLCNSKKKINALYSLQSDRDKSLINTTDILKIKTPLFESTLLDKKRKRNDMHSKSSLTYIDKRHRNTNPNNVSFMRSCFRTLNRLNKYSSTKKTNIRIPLKFYPEVTEKARSKSLLENTNISNESYFLEHRKFLSANNKRDANYTFEPYKHENLHKLNIMRQKIKNNCRGIENYIFFKEHINPWFYECRSRVYIPRQCNSNKCGKRIRLRDMQHKCILSDPSLINRLSLSKAPRSFFSKRCFQINDKRKNNERFRKPQNILSEPLQSKITFNNSTKTTFSKTNKNRICVHSKRKCTRVSDDFYTKESNTKIDQNRYVSNTGTKSLLELFRPDHKCTKVVSKNRNIEPHIKMCQCTSFYCVPDTYDSYFCIKNNKRNRYRNKYVSTVKEKRKSKKSMTSIHCKSRSTQSRDNINEKRTKSECYCPSLQTDCVRSNFCFGTDYCKNLSTTMLRSRDLSTKYQTVSDSTSAKKGKQNDTKRCIPDGSTLQLYNTDEDITPPSYSDCICKILIRSNKIKKHDYPRNVQKYDFENNCPCYAIEKKKYNKPVSKFTKKRQCGNEKDYAITSILKQVTKKVGQYKSIGLHNDTIKFSPSELNVIKRRRIGIQKHEIKASTSFVTKSAYHLKTNSKLTSNSRHIIQNKYEVVDSVSDNRKKVSDQIAALRDCVCEPGFLVPYQCNQDKWTKQRKKKFRSPQESKAIIRKTRRVGSSTKESFRKPKLVSHKYVQTENSIKLKVFRGFKGVTRFGSGHNRPEVIKPLKQKSVRSIYNTPQCKSMHAVHNLRMKTSKSNYKKQESKNTCRLYEDITKDKYKSNRKVSNTITLQSTPKYYDVYSKPEMVKSKKKRRVLPEPPHGSKLYNSGSRGRMRNVLSKLLSISADSYRRRKFLNVRTNRAARVARSHTVPKVPVELENFLKNPRSRRVYTIGSNISLSVQFYKENSMDLGDIASSPKKGPAVSRSTSSSPYGSHSLSLGILKKLRSLFTSQVTNKFKNTRLYDKNNKPRQEIVKQEIVKSIPNHEFLENEHVISHRNSLKYKSIRNHRIHQSSHENTIKKQKSKNILPKYQLLVEDNSASQSKDTKSKNHYSRIIPEGIVNKQIVKNIVSKNELSINENINSTFKDEKSKNENRIKQLESTNITKRKFVNIDSKYPHKFLHDNSDLLTSKRRNREFTFRKAIRSKCAKSKFNRRNKECNKQVVCTCNESNKQRHNDDDGNRKYTSTLPVKSTASYSKSTLTKLKQVAKNVYECEPHVCIPGVCDPNVCYKILKSKIKSVKDMSILAKKKEKSKLVGTNPFEQDTSIAKRCFCILMNKKVKNIEKIIKKLPDNSIKDISHPSIKIKKPNKKVVLPKPNEKINKQSKRKNFICKCFGKFGLINAEKESRIALSRKPAVYKRGELHKNVRKKSYKAHSKAKQDLVTYNYGNIETLMPYSKKKFKKSKSKMTIVGFYESKKQELVTEMSLRGPKTHEYRKIKEQNTTASEIHQNEPNRGKYKKRSKQKVLKRTEKQYISSTEISISRPNTDKYRKIKKQNATSSEDRLSNPIIDKNKYSKKRDFLSSEITLSQARGIYKKSLKQNVPNRFEKQYIPPTKIPISGPKKNKHRKIKERSATVRELILEQHNRSKYKKIKKQDVSSSEKSLSYPNRRRNRKKEKQDILATKISVDHQNTDKYRKQRIIPNEIVNHSKRGIKKKRNKKDIPARDSHNSLSIANKLQISFSHPNRSKYKKLNNDNHSASVHANIRKQKSKSPWETRKQDSFNNDDTPKYRVPQKNPIDSKSPDTPVISKYVQHLNAITKCLKTAIFNLPLGLPKKRLISDHYKHLKAEDTEPKIQQRLSKKHKYEEIDKKDICPICERTKLRSSYKHKQERNKQVNTQQAHAVPISRKICCKESPSKLKSAFTTMRSTCLQGTFDNSECFKIPHNQNSFNVDEFCCNKSLNQSKRLGNHFKQIKLKNRKGTRLHTASPTSRTPDMPLTDWKRSENVKIFQSNPFCGRDHNQPELSIPLPKSVPGFFKSLYRKKSKQTLPKQNCPICLKSNLVEIPPADFCTNKCYISGTSESVESKRKIKKQKKMETERDKLCPLFDMVVDADTMKVTNKYEMYRNLKGNFNAEKPDPKRSQKKQVLPPAIDLVINRDDSILLNGDYMLRALGANRRRMTKPLIMKTNTFTMSQPCSRHLLGEKPPIKIVKSDQPKSNPEYCTCCICSNDPKVRRQNHPKNCTCCICRYGCRYGVKIRKKESEIRHKKNDEKLKLGEKATTNDVLHATASEISSLVGNVKKLSGHVTGFVSDIESIISQLRVKPCSCGLRICKKETRKLEELRRRGLKANVPPECVCGSKVCKLKHTKKTPYYKEKEKLKKKKAKEKKKREKRLRKETIARIKRYSKENASMRKRIRRQDKKAMKTIEKYEDYSSSWAMLAENAADVGRFGINTLYRMITSFKRIICHPRDIKYRVKLARADPTGTAAKSLQEFRDSGYSGTLARVRHRCATMQTSKYLVSAMESHPVTNYLFHFRDKDPKQKLFKQKPMKEEPDIDGNTFLSSLRKKPCLWLYRLCPSFYPHCLSLLNFWRQFTDVIIFLLAVAVWSPCILFTEFCRTVMCCFMCAGGG